MSVMKSSVKFNEKFLPRFLGKFLPVAKDLRMLINPKQLSKQEFSAIISYFYNGNNVFKTTAPGRHEKSNDAIINKINSIDNAIIIDVGASDGSTSLDIIEKLNFNFGRYFVTDINFGAYIMREGKNTYFFDSKLKECIVIVNDKIIVYYDKNAHISPISNYSFKRIKEAPKFNIERAQLIDLCQPELKDLVKKNSKVRIEEWDIFEEWKFEKADIIKVANVLNRTFFNDQLLLKALENLKGALTEHGVLFVVENRECERWSVFEFENNKFVEIGNSNGGTEIKDLITKC